MKRALLLGFVFSAFTTLQAQTSFISDTIQYMCASQYNPYGSASRATVETSDTIDILHMIISLETDFTTSRIKGNCQVQFKSKLDNTSKLFLDLLRMKIDSIVQDGQILNYTYADSITLHISLLNTLQQGDSAAVTVYYNGKPEADNSTFGGFYFQNGFAYNLGVGSNYYPHMLGRAWYPCFDNFVERATYEYFITAVNTKKAICNGEMLGSVDNGNSTTTWHWKIDEEIPGYLASISVGPYTTVDTVYNGVNGPVPVVLAAAPGDTSSLKRSFLYLPNAFNTFEEHYGPYRWNRIGYCTVPFARIAMEHATNITYPMGTVLNSPTAYDYLYAHELSHHWFGNLITPRTAEDYWLKEGWAVFSEKLFYKYLYGQRKYLDEVANIHEQSVHYAHIYDKGYLPVSPMPQQYTYGKTVYNKASDMAHVMPAYLGDYLFYSCLKSYFNDNAYTDQDSRSFRDYMSNCSGIDLTDYFNDWIFSPGWTHFSVDSFTINELPTIDSTGEYMATVYIRQRLNNAPHYYRNVPLEVTFMDENMESITQRIIVDGACSVYKTRLTFRPVFVCTDLAEKIQDAITENYDTITGAGSYNFQYGKMTVVVNSTPANAFLRIEHNFIAPDSMKTPVDGLHLSQERYWRVDGVIPDGFDALGIIGYNGQAPVNPSSASNYYLDTKLITNSEDSLVMMYREGVGSDWQIDTGIAINVAGNANNKTGAITINHLRKGEYALAIWQAGKVDSAMAYIPFDTCYDAEMVEEVGVRELPKSGNFNFNIYPNPARDYFTVDGALLSTADLDVYNINGQLVYHTQAGRGKLRQQLSTAGWEGGIYLLRITGTDRRQAETKKVVVIK